jgi:shikimate dehydrogenase
MILSGRARFAGVMGWPVAHSRSPHIHGYWLEQNSIDGTYLPLAIRPELLGAALAALPVLGFRGCNLTVPHKEAAIAHVHSLSEMARQVGAVNTVTVGPDGKLHGDNTDAYGFISHLRDRAPNWQADRPATILGSGGSARAVIAALVGAGVSEIRLLNRTAERAASLATAFGGAVRPVPWEKNAAALEGCGLLINSTTLGMAGQPPLEIDLERLPVDAAVYDLVYAPLETGLLKAARARGNAAVDGLGMLIYQARPGFTAWFGADPEITTALWSFVAEGL